MTSLAAEAHSFPALVNRGICTTQTVVVSSGTAGRISPIPSRTRCRGSWFTGGERLAARSCHDSAITMIAEVVSPLGVE